LLCGHRLFARGHIIWGGLLVHLVSMCSMVSVMLHVWHS
jgi:hypothetical protein